MQWLNWLSNLLTNRALELEIERLRAQVADLTAALEKCTSETAHLQAQVKDGEQQREVIEKVLEEATLLGYRDGLLWSPTGAPHCPACRGGLVQQAGALFCPVCKVYPLGDGSGAAGFIRCAVP